MGLINSMNSRASTTRVPDHRLSQDDMNLLVLDIVLKLKASYTPGKDRVVTPENVHQPAVTAGRDALEIFQERLMLPGSQVEGLENLDECLAQMQAGKSILFLPEHRGNLDVPSFNALLRREDPRYHEILDKLIYIAGRKLNESSEFIKMFTEKYSRLVIVPKRDFPKPKSVETAEEAEARSAFEKEASRINRSAFREMIRLRKAGYIFVLFPLGGRLKPDADNIPVKETASYLQAFDTAFMISMDGNTLPPLSRMEDERPIQDRVVFRVGPALNCAAFIAEQRAAFEEALKAGLLPDQADFEQYTAEHIMTMLANLRLTGRYENPSRPLPA
jgi:glycerol-3-phosphate O-acyltransferase